jgi:hypothetical protein
MGEGLLNLSPMYFALLFFSVFHFYMLRWGVRSFWRQVHLELGR